jgi:hypothetical protein
VKEDQVKNRAFKEYRTAALVLPSTAASDPEVTLFGYEKRFSADRNRGSHMIRQLLLTLTVLAFAACLTPAMGQIIAADTFKVVDVMGEAGTIVPVKLLVKNQTTTLMGIVAYFKIDPNVMSFVYDTDPLDGKKYVRVALVERGLTVGNVFDSLGFVPLQMVLSDSTHAVLIAAGANQNIYYPEGRGVLLAFQLQIKAGIGLGTEAPIQIYHPNEVGSGTSYCEYTDRYGMATIYPTVVSGMLTVGIPPVITNNPPVINPISQTSYNVQLASTVTFSVTATDPDSPQPITLRANGLPAGATFGTGGVVVGNGAASGTFTWANISQVGNFTVIFTCVDDSGATADPSRSVSINVGTPPATVDILYTASSTTYRQITGGIPGLTGVAIPINLNNLGDSYGVQFDFLYDKNVIIIDSLVPTERLTDFTIYDNVGGSPGNIRVVAFGLDNQRIAAGTTSGTAIFNFWGTIRTNALAGNSPILFENAWEATNSNPAIPSVKLKFDTTGVLVVDRFGDVNGDTRVDVADAVVTVGYIIGDHTFSIRQFNAADIDQSAAVDVIDLVAIINIIFGTAPSTMPQWNGKEAIVRLGDDNGIVTGNSIDVNAELPTDIAGMQVEIGYNPEKVQFLTPQSTDKSVLLSLTYRDDGQGKLVVLLYPRSASGSRISARSGTMIKLPFVSTGELTDDDRDVHINTAVLSDPNAIGIPVKGLTPLLPTDFTLNQNYPNPFNPETTIEFAVGSESANRQVRLVVYNLLGETIATIINEPLPAGKYTYKWRGTSQDGQTVASGVYLYRLMVGDQSQTKKMVLLK